MKKKKKSRMNIRSRHSCKENRNGNWWEESFNMAYGSGNGVKEEEHYCPELPDILDGPVIVEPE